MRHLRRGAGSDRRLLRALRRENASGAPAGSARDPGRAAVLPHGRGAGDRVHLDLFGPAVAAAPPLPNPLPKEEGNLAEVSLTPILLHLIGAAFKGAAHRDVFNIPSPPHLRVPRPTHTIVPALTRLFPLRV